MHYTILVSCFLFLSTSAAAVSQNGRCGLNNGQSCLNSAYGSCCSQYNWWQVDVVLPLGSLLTYVRLVDPQSITVGLVVKKDLDTAITILPRPRSLRLSAHRQSPSDLRRLPLAPQRCPHALRHRLLRSQSLKMLVVEPTLVGKHV